MHCICTQMVAHNYMHKDTHTHTYIIIVIQMHANIYICTCICTYVYVVYICTVWVTKKFPFFETRYRATVILRSVFVSVPFYNFPCFYCCVSILKVWRKERLKNGKKNGAKTVQRSVFFPLRFFLTIVHLCLYLDKNFEIPR